MKRKRGEYVEPTRDWHCAEIQVLDRKGALKKTIIHRYPGDVDITSNYMEIAQALLGSYTPTVKVMITRYWTPTHPESVICVLADETLSWI